MPFDGTDFDPRPPAPPPRPRRMSKRDESILLWLALAFVLGLLVAPISADGLVDIVRYVQGRPRVDSSAYQKRLPGTPLKGPASREVIQPP